MIPLLNAPVEAVVEAAAMAHHLLPEAVLTAGMEYNIRAVILLLRAQSEKILAAAVAAADITLMAMLVARAACISASIFKGV